MIQMCTVIFFRFTDVLGDLWTLPNATGEGHSRDERTTGR